MTSADNHYSLMTPRWLSRLATAWVLTAVSPLLMLGGTLIDNAQAPTEAGMAYYGREVFNDYNGTNFGSNGKLGSVSFYVQAEQLSKDGCPTCNFYAVASDANSQPYYTTDHIDLSTVPVGSWMKVTL